MRVFLKVSLCIALVGPGLSPTQSCACPEDLQPIHYAASQPTEERIGATIKLADSAIALYKKEGFKASLKIFTNQKGPYCTRYEHQYSGLIILDAQGTVLSYCKLPGLIGKNTLSWKSPDGTMTIPKILAAVKANPSGAFLSFVSNLDPHTNKPGAITLYARKVGNLIFCAPAYHVEPMHKDLAPQEDVASYTTPR